MLDLNGLRIGTQMLRRNFQHDRKLYPDLVYLSSNLRVDGSYVSDYESFEASDGAIDEWEGELGFLVVGVRTINGKRDQIIYAKDGPALVNELRTRLKRYSPEIDSQPDADWSQAKSFRTLA